VNQIKRCVVVMRKSPDRKQASESHGEQRERVKVVLWSFLLSAATAVCHSHLQDTSLSLSLSLTFYSGGEFQHNADMCRLSDIFFSGEISR
jgi:hypothetical protein